MFKYINCKEMGHGAFGSILRATQTTAENQPIRLVALKKLIKRPQTERNPINQDPAEEIEILKAVSHENVIECLDSFEEGQYTYIVMPLCPLSVADLVYGYKFRPTSFVVKSITFQILAGLACLHSLNIVHRDMKPRNVLLTEAGRVKICDFGQTYQTVNQVGTRNYRAPESVLNLQNDERSDIFSAGCVIFELLTGRLLFTAGNDIELIVLQNQIIGPFSSSQTLQKAPDLSKIVLESDFEPQSGLRKICADYQLDNDAIELIEQMTKAEPELRPTAQQLMESEFAKEGWALGPGAVLEFMQAAEGQ